MTKDSGTKKLKGSRASDEETFFATLGETDSSFEPASDQSPKEILEGI